MTDDRELSLILDRWLAEGPTEMPDRVVDVVASGISRQRQRPRWRLDRRLLPVNPPAKAGVAIAAVILVAFVGISLNGGPQFIVTTASPSDHESPQPTPSPSASATPTPRPSPSRADLVLNDKGMVVIEHFTARVGTRIEYLLPDGRSQELLPDVPGNQYTPAWRPDGLSLAFVAAQSGDDDRLGIWATDASGTIPTNITTECTPPDCFEESDPSYSPEGNRMVFMRSSGTIATGPTSTIIAIRDLTTGAVRVLESTRTAIADGEVHHPRLSPDGKTVLYHVLKRRSNGDAVESAIVTAAVDGTGQAGPARAGRPSPSRRRMVARWVDHRLHFDRRARLELLQLVPAASVRHGCGWDRRHPAGHRRMVRRGQLVP